MRHFDTSQWLNRLWTAILQCEHSRSTWLRRRGEKKGFRCCGQQTEETRKKKILLSILQMPITVWKTGLEKQASSLRVMPLGKPSFRGLCWCMKMIRASAWTPYFSRVQAVRSSHRFFCSHHRAWSDQSCLISAEDKNKTSLSKITLWVNHVHYKLLLLWTSDILNHILIEK